MSKTAGERMRRLVLCGAVAVLLVAASWYAGLYFLTVAYREDWPIFRVVEWLAGLLAR